MRKRLSRRRVKAQARLGRKLPWSLIVDRNLQNWGEWEREHDTMCALQVRRSRRGVDHWQRTIFVAYPIARES